jgi:radical SAM superfamily enzyme YgiQ (UPF0313 family)
MREAGQVLILSCYELGHQPVAAATAGAFLTRAGFRPDVLDLSVEPLDPDKVARARLVAVSVPMHTALRRGVAAARRVRSLRPQAHVCFYGLYAVLNAGYLLDGLADSVIGGEFEEPLTRLAQALARGEPPELEGVGVAGRPAAPYLKRLPFPIPQRALLPPLERYARLAHGGRTRLAGAVEASRGCLHHCRHCPIPPVYSGRFFAVPREVVLEDIRQLVALGATHVSFADPDFLNGPTHALRVVRAMREEFAELTFDCTTKIEHIVRHRAMFPELAARGCLFVVSAVESLSDRVLGHLAKGHTREDVFRAVGILRQTGIALRPSLVPFTPWATLGDYEELLDWIEDDDLIDHIDPVQLSIRLLVPPGSLLLELPAMKPHLRGAEPENFVHAWEHPDSRMDALHHTVSSIVREAARSDEPAEATFGRIRRATAAASGFGDRVPPRTRPAHLAAASPRLTEPWFC